MMQAPNKGGNCLELVAVHHQFLQVREQSNSLRKCRKEIVSHV